MSTSASAEPETFTSAEPETFTSAEPETVAIVEPTTLASAEPETLASAEPETIGSAEPETLASAEPETLASAEPEAISSAEPETLASAEPETVASAEPEAIGSAEPETLRSAEPETLPSAEPKSLASAEPKTLVSAEPERLASAEPETAASAEPETADPEMTGSPEPETLGSAKMMSGSAEPEVTGSAEPYVEPFPEVTSEPYSEPELLTNDSLSEPEVRPSKMEIFLPPTLLLAAIILGLLCLLVYRKYCGVLAGTRKGKKRKRAERLPVSSPISDKVYPIDLEALDVPPNVTVLRDDENQAKDRWVLLTDFDCEVLDSLATFYNTSSDLTLIALPALMSLCLAPITLLLYDPFMAMFWPDEPNMPNINDAIACFLAPAGLVYATSFGFAFQSAMMKQGNIMARVTHEISLIDQIVTLVSKMHLPLEQKLRLFRAAKTEAIFMVLQVEGREVESFENKPDCDIRVAIWEMLDCLRHVKKDNMVDKLLMREIITHILQLNSITSDKMGIFHGRIHPLKWLFLETLGFFSFFGILLVTTGSSRLELVMCIITVFSISLLCYIVSDLDSPFSGFFRVDVSVLAIVIERTEQMYRNVTEGKDKILYYPQKPQSVFSRYLNQRKQKRAPTVVNSVNCAGGQMESHWAKKTLQVVAIEDNSDMSYQSY